MTIKEFAGLCGCTAQTLRYYDRIDLLKPERTDPWTGYRYYAAEQALDFVRIKNLQAADFSIGEIRTLLAAGEAEITAAFRRKIAAQTEKLRHIREIYQSYLAEKSHMEQIAHSMTEYLLRQCRWEELREEFGLTAEEEARCRSGLRPFLTGSWCRRRRFFG